MSYRNLPSPATPQSAIVRPPRCPKRGRSPRPCSRIIIKNPSALMRDPQAESELADVVRVLLFEAPAARAPAGAASERVVAACDRSASPSRAIRDVCVRNGWRAETIGMDDAKRILFHAMTIAPRDPRGHSLFETLRTLGFTGFHLRRLGLVYGLVTRAAASENYKLLAELRAGWGLGPKDVEHIYDDILREAKYAEGPNIHYVLSFSALVGSAALDERRAAMLAELDMWRPLN